MTRVELDEATDPLSEYTRRARKEPVVVTDHAKPLALLRSLSDDEWEDFVVSSDPRFAAMFERAQGALTRRPALGPSTHQGRAPSPMSLSAFSTSWGLIQKLF
jgi:antitoxin (DNA-binding transcriptional repressor) of toxin-antitoxin stability system